MLFRSIRWRIAVPVVLLILITMTGLGVFLSNNQRQLRLAELEERLSVDARILGDTTQDLFPAAGGTADLDVFAKRWAEITGGRVTIVGNDGVVLGESLEDRTQMDNHLMRPEIIQASAEGSGSSIRFSRTVGFEMMYSAVAVTAGQDLVGFVRVALPLQEIEAEIARLRGTILAATLLAAVVAMMMATFIAARTTLPLRNLTQAVQKLAMGEAEEQLVPPTRDEVGQLTRAFNTMVIRLQDEYRSLSAERTKLDTVLYQMTDGVLLVDENGDVQLLNLAAEKLFGIRSEQALGQSFVQVVRHHQLVELWEKALEMGEEQVAAYEFGPHQIFLQVIAIPFEVTLEGNVLLVLQDLTRLRRLETVRRDFLSNISHELRTPLASMRALVETLLEGALEDPPAARRFLGRMETEVDSLTQMVQELLELTRIESGRVPLQLEKIAPERLLQSATERLQLQAERAGLSVKVEYPAELPPVLADPQRLEQVLVNLLHNAIKFTPPGGEVRLAAEVQDDDILFSVADTGVGIPADDLPRIFERFYKTDRARSGGGTGLGLAIARHLVQAHGGQIWGESVEGAGSTFYFRIPSGANKA